jgi:hypothetical protein
MMSVSVRPRLAAHNVAVFGRFKGCWAASVYPDAKSSWPISKRICARFHRGVRPGCIGTFWMASLVRFELEWDADGRKSDGSKYLMIDATDTSEARACLNLTLLLSRWASMLPARSRGGLGQVTVLLPVPREGSPVVINEQGALA